MDEDVHILLGVRSLLLSWVISRRLRLIPDDYPRQISAIWSAENGRARPSAGAPPSAEDGRPRPSAGAPPSAEDGRPRPSAGAPPPAEDGRPRPGAGAPPSAKDDPPRPGAGPPPSAVDARLMEEFPRVFDGHIRTMPGEEFHIHLRADARPFCVTTPRRVPLALRDQLKAEVDRLESEQIIRRVTDPTEWCAPIVVAPKKGGAGIRLCVDLSHLNRFVRREFYQAPTPAEQVASIAASQACWFTVFDALKGYHQCPLAEESQLLTTFTTPFGRFAFCRAPYGVTSISEHYNRRMDEAFEGLTGFRKVVDDVIIFSRTLSEHLQHVREFLSRCQERGISLNKEKLQLAQQSVKFAGFIVSQQGYRPDPHLTKALSEYPPPSNITELRGFVGLVNQVASFVDDVAELLAPLRLLLSPRREFLWNEEHQRAFDTAKAALSSAPTMAFYDPKRPTSLATDASRLRGLGFVLRQAQPDGTWRVIQAGSRFLSDAETRYATIELEALAVAWAIKKCRLFLAGIPCFQIATDHRPLVPILNSKTLDEIENPRLQRLRMKIGEVGSFTAVWIPGSQHQAPDALSRAPVQDPDDDDEVGEDAAVPGLCSIIAAEIAETQTDLSLEEVRRAAAYDPEQQALQEAVRTGFPEAKADLSELVRPYWPVHERLSVDDGLVVCGCRLVIPRALRRAVLEALHDGHLGKERTKARARQIVFWPGLDRDIENIIRECRRCQRELPAQQRETLIHRPAATRPFQHLDMDLAEHAGSKYLVVVDGFSGWRFVEPLGKCAPTRKLTGALKGIFCRVGVPDAIWTDGGPQFTSSSFRLFTRKWRITHHVSSPTARSLTDVPRLR